MIKTALVWRLHELCQRQEDGRCQPVHLRRRPPLIRHHLKGLAVFGTAQDGTGEVRPLPAIKPAGTHDKMIGTQILNGLLSGQLAGAVDIERGWRIRLAPEPTAGAIEHIVGGEVRQQRPLAQASRASSATAR